MFNDSSRGGSVVMKLRLRVVVGLVLKNTINTEDPTIIKVSPGFYA
jgi:hypothetical protein